eukprot:1157943-Pelagomonas_calceolata.AAC.3
MLASACSTDIPLVEKGWQVAMASVAAAGVRHACSGKVQHTARETLNILIVPAAVLFFFRMYWSSAKLHTEKIKGDKQTHSGWGRAD